MTILIIVIIALVVICLLYILATQRRLVSLQEKMKNSLGQINAQLKTRWDAVTALVEMTKQYDVHEHDTLMDVIAQRKTAAAASAEDVNQQNAAVSDILGRLNVVVERYPELKANDMFNNTMNGIKQYEENVRLSRMVYNDCVTKLNILVRQWPSSIVANMLHFTTAEYIAEEKEKSNMPDIGSIFNGGKGSKNA
jgi:LemA protein